jgi:hypothetical protein
LFFLAGFYDTHDITVQFAAAFFSESTGHLLVGFTLSKIPFRIIIMEFHIRVMQEQKVVILILYLPAADVLKK